MLHARRPLYLDELCEAVAIYKTTEGCDIDHSQKPFKKRVTQLCEPLIQIQEVSELEANFPTCKFHHASFRDFLLKNEAAYTGGSACNGYNISRDTMANVCLRYLAQPRYSRFLTFSGSTFQDIAQSDIMDHGLLTYAAKYWDKHLDEVKPSESKSEEVIQFVKSTRFQTTLQVQSLFAEGLS